MTTRAPAWFERKYVSGAIHVLQDKGRRLLGTTLPPARQNGNEVVWKLAGRGDATAMTASGVRPTLNADRTTVTATMVAWEANEEIDIVDIEQMTESEQQIAQQTCGFAMGRRYDRIILDSMTAAGAAIPDVGAGGTTPTPMLFQNAQAVMLGRGTLADPTIYVAVPYIAMAHLNTFPEFMNSQYVGDNPILKMMGARTWAGMTFIPCPNEYFLNGLADTDTFTGNTTAGFMWFQSAVGFAEAKAMDSRIDYIAKEKKWFAANTFMAQAACVLPTACRRVLMATTLPATRQQV